MYPQCQQVGPPSVGLDNTDFTITDLGGVNHRKGRVSLDKYARDLPPETLKRVFRNVRWDAIPEGEFGGPRNGSHNLLLVRHHWFEVSSNTRWAQSFRFGPLREH